MTEKTPGELFFETAAASHLHNINLTGGWSAKRSSERTAIEVAVQAAADQLTTIRAERVAQLLAKVADMEQQLAALRAGRDQVADIEPTAADSDPPAREKYTALSELASAYGSGELDRKFPLRVDNDSASVWTGDDADLSWESVFDMHPSDLLGQALDLLGVPHENV
jgi:hypothetical protein